MLSTTPRRIKQSQVLPNTSSAREARDERDGEDHQEDEKHGRYRATNFRERWPDRPRLQLRRSCLKSFLQIAVAVRPLLGLAIDRMRLRPTTAAVFANATASGGLIVVLIRAGRSLHSERAVWLLVHRIGLAFLRQFPHEVIRSSSFCPCRVIDGSRSVHLCCLVGDAHGAQLLSKAPDC